MIPQNQEIFNILLEAVSEGVIIVDSTQKIVEVNQTAETLFGYKKRELLQKELNSLIPPEYHKNHHNHFENFIKSGERRSMKEASDIYGLKKNGSKIAIEVELSPFTIYNNSYVMALINDVSERKEIERNLMLKSSALQSASNGVFITDALQEDNPIIYSNTAFQNLTGYSSEEIINRNCRFLQGIDGDKDSLKLLKEAFTNANSSQIKLRNYKKDGTFFWNDIYIMPIINSEGVVTNYISIQNDITNSIKAEEESNHLSNIIHKSLNEIYVFDVLTLKFLNVNYGAQKNLGYTLKELQKLTPLDLKINDSVTDFRENMAVLLKKDLEKLEFESVHQRKDGSLYPVEVHLQLSCYGEKEVFVAIVLDITERKNYTKKLEKTVEERTKQLKMALSKEKELNELKTKFLTLVSHEFKTPLSGILTSSVLLGKYKRSKEQDKRDKHVKIIGDKVEYLNTILNDFLSLERLESGMLKYNLSHFKLSKVIDEVIYNANMLLKEGQFITYPDNIDDLSLFQDEKIMVLVLSNLINNSILYSKAHTTITIGVAQDNTFTTIEIKDQSIGIPLADQKNIFDRYFRARNVVNIQGTGIGLNIVKTHLENLGGTIRFTSKENEGATFTITLPNTAKQ
ncbi:PAS domain S-box protein [Bizionia gelidisalsuginis]|uniref:histidine kinase n=1 Tax=Bizionia gelidisalsuginis TaxID=291188 RepID=A0ABY3M7K8_9FLAO|nr:PAS domain-containing sensor histidine kinase [Bizionia gelidisalsuginis]TYC09178.1 PAS domain S-box protein [Bizionia gelidisalsuginis]